MDRQDNLHNNTFTTKGSLLILQPDTYGGVELFLLWVITTSTTHAQRMSLVASKGYLSLPMEVRPTNCRLTP